MIEERKRDYTDYACYKSSDIHSYRVRLFSGLPLLLKVRLTCNEPKIGNRLFLKMNFQKGISQVWQLDMDQKTKSERITINHVFAPDWSQIDKLKNKIRTYLVFS